VIRNRVTELSGVDHPIVQGGMHHQRLGRPAAAGDRRGDPRVVADPVRSAAQSVGRGSGTVGVAGSHGANAGGRFSR
jgi:hypothetical protein